MGSTSNPGIVTWDDLSLARQIILNKNRHAFGLAPRAITALWDEDVVESPQRTEDEDVPVGIGA